PAPRNPTPQTPRRPRSTAERAAARAAIAMSSSIPAEPRVPPCDRRLQPPFLGDPAELVARGEVRGLDHHVELGVRSHRGPEPGDVPDPVRGPLGGLDDEGLVLRDLLGE